MTSSSESKSRTSRAKRDAAADEPALPAPKAAVRRMLEKLPDDASYEEIQYRIYCLQKIQQGLDDVAAGRVYSQEEAAQRVDKWLTGLSGRRKRPAI